MAKIIAANVKTTKSSRPIIVGKGVVRRKTSTSDALSSQTNLTKIKYNKGINIKEKTDNVDIAEGSNNLDIENFDEQKFTETMSSFAQIPDITITTNELADSNSEIFKSIYTGVIKKNISTDTDYDISVSENMSNFDKVTRENIIHRTLNIQGNESRKDLNKLFTKYFDRYYSIYPDMELTNLYHYIFMTRPDLNIIDDKYPDNKKILVNVAESNSIYEPIYATNPDIVLSLTQGFSTKHAFAPIITSRIESIQLPDYSVKSYMIQQPYTGYSIPYASHAIASTTGGTFNVVLRETADLAIHKMFQIWLSYINDINIGKYYPKKQYVYENRMDYGVSFYDLICAPNGIDILYWVKYTGCFPQLLENSSLSFNLRGETNKEVSIPFEYFLSEPLKWHVLVDFNKNAHVYKQKNKDSSEVILDENLINTADHIVGYRNTSNYNFHNYGTSYGLYERPYIELSKSDFPKLRWIRDFSL